MLQLRANHSCCIAVKCLRDPRGRKTIDSPRVPSAPVSWLVSYHALSATDVRCIGANDGRLRSASVRIPRRRNRPEPIPPPAGQAPARRTRRDRAARGHARRNRVPPSPHLVPAAVPMAGMVRCAGRVDCTADRLRTAIGRACKAAGVPVFSPHDLRHRRISLLHRQGTLLGRDRTASRPAEALDHRRHVRARSQRWPRGRLRGPPELINGYGRCVPPCVPGC